MKQRYNFWNEDFVKREDIYNKVGGGLHRSYMSDELKLKISNNKERAKQPQRKDLQMVERIGRKER